MPAAESPPFSELLVRNLSIPPLKEDAFVQATGGRRDAAAVPLLFSAGWEARLVLDVLRISGLPFPWRGVVHTADRRTFVRPVHREGTCDLRLSLTGQEPHRKGTRLTIASSLRTPGGQDLVVSESDYLFLGLDAIGEGTGTRSEGDIDGWELLDSWPVDVKDARRYARASGDFNPIHLGTLPAVLMGQKRAILHGFCAEAMVGNRLASRQGSQPCRIDVRFVRPIELPSVLRLFARPISGSELDFRVAGSGVGAPYLVGRAGFAGSGE